VIAAKAIATFARQHDVLEYRGGIMDGEPLDPEKFGAIARLPGLDVLHGQLVGVTASPLTGLTRGLAAMISGLAVGLGQIAEKGLVGGGDEPAAAEAPAAEEAKAEEPQAEEPAEEPQAEETAEEPEAEEPAAEEEPEAEVKAEEEAPETSSESETEEAPEGSEAEGSDSEGSEEAKEE
jgi:large subunit ribosomal protein L10